MSREMDNIRLNNNEFPKCPFCGHDHETSEIDFMIDRYDKWGNGLDIECDCCEREFIVYRDITVTYSTRAKEGF